MWRTQSHEIVHFAAVFLQIWKSSSTNEAAKTVCDDAYLSEAASRTILVNMSIDFLSQSYTHFIDISLCVVLIGWRHKEHYLREAERDIVLDHFHVLRVTLEAVNKDPEMYTIIVVFFWCPTFRVFLLQCFLLFLGLLTKFGHVSDKALLKYDGLKILKASQSLLCLEFLQLRGKCLTSRAWCGMELVRDFNYI